LHYTSLSRGLFTLSITTIIKMIFYSGSINSCDANILVESTIMLVGLVAESCDREMKFTYEFFFENCTAWNTIVLVCHQIL